MGEKIYPLNYILQHLYYVMRTSQQSFTNLPKDVDDNYELKS